MRARIDLFLDVVFEKIKLLAKRHLFFPDTIMNKILFSDDNILVELHVICQGVSLFGARL